MKIWLEALTAKQALLMAFIANELNKLGYTTIITTRQYDYAVGILKDYGFSPIIVGEYGGKELVGKLLASIKRMELLTKLLSKEHINACISFTSPDASRVAFGLKIPLINLSDSPHSYYVNKLAIPLSDILITLKCIPKQEFEKYIEASKIIQFDGFFELAWILRKRPNRNVLKEFNLEEEKYVILRTEEKFASYYYDLNTKKPTLLDIVIDSIPKDYDIIVFPRYLEQKKYLLKKYEKRIIIPEHSLDTQSLIYFSKLVVTGGSTFAQEAALMGVPALSYFPYIIYTFTELKRRGFPFYHVNNINLLPKIIKELLNRDTKKDVKKMLQEMEDPIPIIIREIEKIAK